MILFPTSQCINLRNRSHDPDVARVQRYLKTILSSYVDNYDGSETSRQMFEETISVNFAHLKSLSLGSKMLSHICEIYRECALRSLNRIELVKQCPDLTDDKRINQLKNRIKGDMFRENEQRQKKTEQLLKIRNEGFCALSDLYRAELLKTAEPYLKAELEVHIFNRLLVIIWEFLKVEIEAIIGEALELMFERMSLDNEYAHARALLLMSEIILSLPDPDRPPCNLFEYIIDQGITRKFSYNVKLLRRLLGLYDIDTAKGFDRWCHRKSDWSKLVSGDADFKYCNELNIPYGRESGWSNYGEGCFGGGGLQWVLS